MIYDVHGRYSPEWPIYWDRNADRFPVFDFWASIMRPQVACVLRNHELNLPDGLGCGHSLFCVVEIQK